LKPGCRGLKKGRKLTDEMLDDNPNMASGFKLRMSEDNFKRAKAGKSAQAYLFPDRRQACWMTSFEDKKRKLQQGRDLATWRNSRSSRFTWLSSVAKFQPG